MQPRTHTAISIDSRASQMCVCTLIFTLSQDNVRNLQSLSGMALRRLHPLYSYTSSIWLVVQGAQHPEENTQKVVLQSTGKAPKTSVQSMLMLVLHMMLRVVGLLEEVPSELTAWHW